MDRTPQNALRDPQIPLDAKTQVQSNMSQRAFMETTPGPPDHESASMFLALDAPECST
jgi:hypothetical protein